MINIFEDWRASRTVRQTRRELYRLSDHILADIGIKRSDIASADFGESGRGRVSSNGASGR